MKSLLFITTLLLSLSVTGQPLVKVEVSADTVAIGGFVEVTYTIENGHGQFQVPDMTGLPLISGPNTSSSMMYQNGQMSSSQSFSFVLRPMDEGLLTIPGTTYRTDGDSLEIQPVEIVIVAEYERPGSPKSIKPSTVSKPAREKKKF